MLSLHETALDVRVLPALGAMNFDPDHRVSAERAIRDARRRAPDAADQRGGRR